MNVGGCEENSVNRTIIYKVKGINLKSIFFKLIPLAVYRTIVKSLYAV